VKEAFRKRTHSICLSAATEHATTTVVTKNEPMCSLHKNTHKRMAWACSFASYSREFTSHDVNNMHLTVPATNADSWAPQHWSVGTG